MNPAAPMRAMRTAIRLPQARPSTSTTSCIRQNVAAYQCHSFNARSLPLLQPRLFRRSIHATAPNHKSKQKAPARSDKSKTPPIDLAELDVLGSAPVPSTNIEWTLPRGFLFNSGLSIYDGDGALLVGGEAFAWRPWLAKDDGDASDGPRLLNARGQVEIPAEAFSVLALSWPRPDLLVVGTGPTIRPLSPETRKHIGELGMRVEVLDTHNASSQFNLLATERGVEDVAAALIPLGWVEGKGAVE